MFIATSLSYYKRPEVQKALVAYASEKEVSTHFAGGYFSKRPDVLSYDNDVLELAKKKATSFHCSEELWYNPLSIRTGMSSKELAQLRKGWDLILDIDCPDWDMSRLTTHLFIRALQHHGIKAVTVKFSGNKGFHIGVPFEVFPDVISFEGQRRAVKELFPQGPRKIAAYLLHFITENFISIDQVNRKVSFLEDTVLSFTQLEKIAQQTNKELFSQRCPDCHKEVRTLSQSQKETLKYQCSHCGFVSRPKDSPDVIRCPKCTYPVQPKKQASRCPHCQSTSPAETSLRLDAVIEVDTILIASRHLYRMPFSLHEKSSLVSQPISLKDVLTFEKEQAHPDKVRFDIPFLDRSQADSSQGLVLLREAFDHNYTPKSSFSKENTRPADIPENAIPEKFFPPCIHNINKGLEDGKKRALFILINFLRSSGWSLQQIEEYVREWNTRNPEPLREQYIKGQLQQVRKGKDVIPPPSCLNHDYYTSLLICTPNSFCSKIKNPAQYAKQRFLLSGGSLQAAASKERVSFLQPSSLHKEVAKECQTELEQILSHPNIHHVGSTALDILGRNEVDIVVGVKDTRHAHRLCKDKGFTPGSVDSNVAMVTKQFQGVQTKVYLCQLHSSSYTEALQQSAYLAENEDVRKKFVALKKKYEGKLMRTYSRVKHKFFVRQHLR